MSILLQNVRKSYREPDGTELPILSIDHYEVQTGEQVALLGPSGGGKTTLLNIIAGITAADSGVVRIAGVDIAKLSEAKRDYFRAMKIGFVFQTFNLLPAFTALENVLLGMSFTGKRADRGEAIRLLESVGLKHRLHHRPSHLSVGEQQRVAVARALVKKPAVLLADEPTANVDTAHQETVLALLKNACKEASVSLLMVTHSLDVAGTFQRVDRLADFNRPRTAAPA